MSAAQASGSRPKRGVVGGLIDFVGSYTLAMINLFILFWLTYFGTVHQVEHGLHDAQVTYFESWFVAHQLGDFAGVSWRLPLPGGQLVMWVMSVNLLVGGILKVVGRGTRVIGILIGHVGILLLIFGGWLRLVTAEEGHVTLYEPKDVARVIGGKSERSLYQHYIDWELAVIRPAAGDVEGREWTFPHDLFDDAGSGPRRVTLRSETMPFSVQVSDFILNCRPQKVIPGTPAKRPEAEGYCLVEQAAAPEVEQNISGLYASVPEAKGAPTGILWGFGVEPWTVVVADQVYLLELRRRRLEMPWSIRLVDFIKEEHPGTRQPRRFASDVVIVDKAGVERDAHISMNRPFRDDGFVVYQASWGPSNAAPGTPLFTTLAVSRNPADRIPWIGVAVVAFGLLLHFGMKFIRFMIRRERRAAMESSL